MSAVLKPSSPSPWSDQAAPSSPLDVSELSAPARDRKPLVIAAVGLLLLAALIGWAVHQMGHGSEGPRRQTVKIAVLPDTPPPPPPPPREEKRPEPDKQELKPQPQEQPKPVDTPPEPQALKMEGAAGDGPSAFTAGSVSSDYKGGEIGTGSGPAAKPVDRMALALFTSQLQRHIQGALARMKDIKGADYRVQVQVVLDPSGAFQKVDLLGSTGDAALDDALRLALSQLPPVGALPPNLPQPLRLRITNRLAG